MLWSLWLTTIYARWIAIGMTYVILLNHTQIVNCEMIVRSSVFGWLMPKCELNYNWILLLLVVTGDKHWCCHLYWLTTSVESCLKLILFFWLTIRHFKTIFQIESERFGFCFISLSANYSNHYYDMSTGCSLLCSIHEMFIFLYSVSIESGIDCSILN